MTPGSFDSATARAVVGDREAREIEAVARCDAEAESYRPPEQTGGTYWDGVMGEMRRVIYHQQFAKRMARNNRKQVSAQN